MQGNDGRFPVRVTADSHFAWMRTRMALERTMMSWVRTSIALVAFGFTIVQFFERFNAMQGVAPPASPFAARYVGLALMAAGVMALLVSAWEYRAVLRHLWHGDFAALADADRPPFWTPVYAITIAMIFIGLLAFVVVLGRAV